MSGDHDCDCDCVVDVNTESGSSRGNSGGGCFIATAAYGSPLEHQVVLLQEFRDNVLSHSAVGRNFIELYYKFSPSVADRIKLNNSARFITRGLLYPIVTAVKFLKIVR